MPRNACRFWFRRGFRSGGSGTFPWDFRGRRLSEDFLRVAFFAVDGFVSVGGVGGGHAFPTLVAFSLEEFSWVTESHAVEVALVGMPFRNREAVLAVEFELLLDNPERLARSFALNRPIENIVGDLRDVGREFGCGDGFFDLRERGFVVGPVEVFGEGFFPGHGKILLRDGFVIPEWGNRGREEFAPFPSLFHMFDDLRNEFFVFFLGVLFIENAVLLVAEADAPETVGATVVQEIRVENRVILIYDIAREEDPVRIDPNGMAFV